MRAAALRRLGSWLLALAVLALASPAAAAEGAAAPPGVAPRVLAIDIDGAITAGTSEYVAAALQRAKLGGYQALVLTLDTPGGDLESTREIVRGLLTSPVPVLVWVGPAGARAASAGTFVTLAADVAAMHPTSNIGAAHPVTGTGGDVEKEAGKDMALKVENDTVAFVRSVAAARGRNADWAEKAVRESVSVTAEEAVKQHVVDLTAVDVPALLAAVDGRTVRPGGGEARVLRLRGAEVERHEPTIRQRVYAFLSDPTIVALLMLVGLGGLALEFYHPGAIFPGAAGALCLFLAFLGTRVVPVNVGAVVLVIAGVALLVAEAFVTSHGLAGLGGAACLALGLLFFVDTSAPGQWFDPSGLALSPWIVWPTPVVLGGVLIFTGWKVARGQRAPLQLGAPALLGASGEALSEVGPEGGEVFLHGEYWRARSGQAIPRGARVRVVAVEGLVVTVEAERAVG